MKNILVIGGSGALGKSVVNTFKNSKPVWKVFNLDFNDNNTADTNIKIDNNEKLTNENFLI